MKENTKAYFYALSAILFWSTVATAFKITLRYLSYINLLLYSSLFSTIILFIILFTQEKLTLLKKMSYHQWINSLFLGLLNPFLYYLVIFKAYSILPAQEAQTLNYTWPIVLVILSGIILGQKITYKNIVALFIGFFGVLTIATHGNLKSFSFSDPLGVLLAIVSPFIWATFWIYNVRDERDEVTKLFCNFLIGFLFTLLFSLVFHINFHISSYALWGSLYIGAFEMSITFTLWLKALTLAKTTAKIGNLVFLTPFLSLVFIHLIIGEVILPSTILGLVFIVVSIVINS